MTREGHAKVLDFGLALLSAPAISSPNDATIPGSARTIPGVAVGTPAYMAPEQAEGRDVDFRADQFALGRSSTSSSTGRRTFARASVVDTLAAVVRDEPDPIPPLPEPLDGPVRRILARCLAKDPEARYAATRDLARDLRDLAALASSRGRLGARDARAPRAAFTRRTAVTVMTLAAAAVALAFLGAGAGLLSRPRRASPRSGSSPSAAEPSGPRGSRPAARTSSTAPRGTATHPTSIPRGSRAARRSRSAEGDASLLAISPSGELLVSLDARGWLPHLSIGTASRMPLVAGAPRPLLEGVAAADYVAGSSDIVVVRDRTDSRGSRFEAGARSSRLPAGSATSVPPGTAGSSPSSTTW